MCPAPGLIPPTRSPDSSESAVISHETVTKAALLLSSAAPARSSPSKTERPHDLSRPAAPALRMAEAAGDGRRQSRRQQGDGATVAAEHRTTATTEPAGTRPGIPAAAAPPPACCTPAWAWGQPGRTPPWSRKQPSQVAIVAPLAQGPPTNTPTPAASRRLVGSGPALGSSSPAAGRLGESLLGQEAVRPGSPGAGAVRAQGTRTQGTNTHTHTV